LLRSWQYQPHDCMENFIISSHVRSKYVIYIICFVKDITYFQMSKCVCKKIMFTNQKFLCAIKFAWHTWKPLKLFSVLWKLQQYYSQQSLNSVNVVFDIKFNFFTCSSSKVFLSSDFPGVTQKGQILSRSKRDDLKLMRLYKLIIASRQF
jgi:hypothetical protein